MSTWLRCRPRHTTVCLRPPPCPALIGIVSFYPSIYLDCYSSPENPFDDNIGLYDYQKVFVGTNWITCKGTGKKEITEFLQKCGDGARVEIAIVTDKGSHIFAAEQIGEKTIFIDPQKNLVSVENYFDMNLLDKTKFCRIDNLDFSTLIKDCMKGAR